MIDLGYRIIYYNDINDKKGTVLHETQVGGYKVANGRIEQSLAEIDNFEFEIMYDHPLYNKINAITGLVKVVNKYDNEIEFYGRILKPESQMDSSGLFSQSFYCESVLGYLHDSTQYLQRIENRGVEDFLNRIITVHNNQVEPHKRFVLGNVTVRGTSDVPRRYVGYETTFDTIKNSIINKFGGYLRLRVEEDDLYLDYLQDVGEVVNQPLQIASNMQSARRSLDLSEIITRLVPLGADLHDENRDEETGQYVVRERVTIDFVNDGKRYIEDPALVEKYGIIQRPMEWTEIEHPRILLQRGQQYMQTQRNNLSSWEIEVVELYLINSRYSKIKLGNTYPVDNKLLSEVENLQVVKKIIDINQVESVDLTVGVDQYSFSKFQWQQREATKSINKFIEDNRVRQSNLAKEQEKQNKTQKILSLKTSKNEHEQRILSIDREVSELNSKLNNSDSSVVESTRQRITLLQDEKKTHENKIKEITEQLKELEKEGGKQ